jgi:hypothetical protein
MCGDWIVVDFLGSWHRPREWVEIGLSWSSTCRRFNSISVGIGILHEMLKVSSKKSRALRVVHTIVNSQLWLMNYSENIKSEDPAWRTEYIAQEWQKDDSAEARTQDRLCVRQK